MKIVLILIISAAALWGQGTGKGTRIDMTQKLGLASGQFAQLFIPDYYDKSADSLFTLVFHFHGASWTAEDEVYKSKSNAVLFNIHLGALSSPYRNYFTNASIFGSIIDTVSALLERGGYTGGGRPGRLIITTFSAGYAGVREVLKSAAYYDMIDAIAIADGLHSSSGASDMQEQLKNFLRFARDAAEGKKIMEITHSNIATSGYQSTTQTADYLLNGLSLSRVSASVTDEIGLMYSTVEKGNFYLRGYRGQTADDHMKHLYNMHIMLGRITDKLNKDITSVEDAGIINGFTLYQNNPNPFNPSTSVSFSNTETAYIIIKVYDLLGRERAELFNGTAMPGVHKVKFDASGLPAGVYFCALTSANYTAVKKMTLLK